MNLKPVAQRLALLLFGFLLAGILAEALLRLWPPASIAYKNVRIPDDRLHHALRASRCYAHRTSEYSVEICTNAAGFRDIEWPSQHDSAFRILVLGDSFVEGYGVPLDSCFVSRFRGLLNAGSGRPRAYHVFNLGVSSYSPLIEYILLKQIGLALHPGLVILCLDMSDIQDDLLYNEMADVDSTGEPVAVKSKVLTFGGSSWMPRGAIGDFVRTRSYLYAFVLPLLESLRGRPAAGPGTWKGRVLHTLDSTSAQWEVPLEGTWLNVTRTARLLKARGIEFVLATYPWGHQVSADEWTEGRKEFDIGPGRYASGIFGWLEQHASRDSIRFFNMTDAFRDHSRGDLYYPVDGHWTPAGHALVADTLFSFLEAQGLLGAAMQIPDVANGKATFGLERRP